MRYLINILDMKQILEAELTEIYLSRKRTTGKDRTNALCESFEMALSRASLVNYRPDQLWTGLQNVFYRQQLVPAFQRFQVNEIDSSDLIQDVLSVRNGWVKSSGSAFENFIEKYFSAQFSQSEYAGKIIVSKKANVGLFKPTNLGQFELGEHGVDDLYLLVKNGSGYIIWAMISAQASGGDRWERASARCNHLRSNGINCINMTLDPRDIARSPHGMLFHAQYLRKFQAENPSYNVHFVLDSQDGVATIPADLVREYNLDATSRIIRADIRHSKNAFLEVSMRMAHQFLRSQNQLSATAHWA